LRDQHFSGSSEASNTRASVHCDSGQIVTDNLAFAGVQATAHFKIEGTHRIADRTSAADRSCRSIKGGKEAVT
jgi:hypothetical protein